MLHLPWRRRRPDPAQLLEQTLAARDFRSAAVFILAGAAEIVYDARLEARAQHPADISARTLQLALARVTRT